MKSLGNHVLLELFDCDAGLLNSKKKVGQILRHSADIAKAHVIGDFFHEFSPHGISGILVISESHFSIHTWPEYSYAAIDLFTCGDSLNLQDAIDYLKESFRSKTASVMEVKRGVLNLPPDKIKHKPKAASLKPYILEGARVL